MNCVRPSLTPNLSPLSARFSAAALSLLAAASLALSPRASGIPAAEPVRAQESKLPKASEIVKPQVSVPSGPVARGQAFNVSVVAIIRTGFHIQANRVLEEYLIPTTLEARLPGGWTLLDTAYPQAKLMKFPFSSKEMAVYEGKVEVKMKLRVDAAAPAGKVILPLVLHYQACSDAACLPPVRLPLEARVEIAPGG